ncbi:hypothetical protein SAMN05216357_105187 [Porphyromonadaceae bacterium KH3CP3RA]|nr:hypothetical protein SAMN05216357_105187 [Porphyromonadaceae bacterium KH3CP3RA]
MKKKIYISGKRRNTVRDPEADYKVSSETKFSTKKRKDKQQKLFDKTLTPENFPNNCVTLDTFFSDLEDYIHRSLTLL